MKNTEIQWATHTFNPWIGCTKVSDGCKNCYAAALDKRWGKKRWGVGAPREHTSASYWKQPLGWNRAAEKAGERHRVFCASLADVFDAEVPEAFLLELLDLVRRTPALDWLLLTKRPELIKERLAKACCIVPGNCDGFDDTLIWVGDWLAGIKVPTNVWLGTTVENQEQTKRLRQLLDVPALVHFASCEPLLEDVDLMPFLTTRGINHALDWVIIGGESGGGARPFDLSWGRYVLEQCRATQTSAFFKQLGSKAASRSPDAPAADLPLLAKVRGKGGDPAAWPADLRVRQFPTDVERAAREAGF